MIEIGTYSVEIKPHRDDESYIHEQDDMGKWSVALYTGRYRIRLGNKGQRRCDAEIYIDEVKVGKYRLTPGEFWSIEKTVVPGNRFRFNGDDVEIRVCFLPEKDHYIPDSYAKLADDTEDDGRILDFRKAPELEYGSTVYVIPLILTKK